MTPPDDREAYGRIVHEIRLAFNAELPHPRGVEAWEKRDPGQQEMDMRIGQAVARQARIDALLDLTEAAIEKATAELVAQAVAAERDRLRAELAETMAAFLTVRGGGQGARDLAEAVRQVIGREPLERGDEKEPS